MSFFRLMWRLVLCALFFIGLTYGPSAHASEPEGQEKAMHETHEAMEGAEEGEVEEEAEETEAEEEAPGEEGAHEMEGETHE